MAEEKRTLIETFLPVDEISAEAKIEKLGNAKPPTSSLHYWWTRKPLVASRAVVLGALLPSNFDQQEFKRLIGLSHNERAHKYDIPIERIEQLKKEYMKVWGKNPTILDPFAGGGSIPFEAMRVGINVIANDYNIVAFLIEKATLEYPRKYGFKLRKDVKEGLEWVYNETKKEMEQYYPKHNGKDVSAYIWAWSVKCPKCGFKTPLVGQWDLVQNKKKKVFLKPHIENNSLWFSIEKGDKTPENTCSQGIGQCLKCGSTILNEHIKEDILKNESEIPLSVVISEKKGKDYDTFSREDFEAFNQSKIKLNSNFETYIKDNLIPLEDMPDDSRGAIWAKLYLKKWHRNLNPRQKLLFIILSKNIREYCNIIVKKFDSDYCLAIMIYLSFILGKNVDYNSRSTSWHRLNQQITSAMSKRGVALSWDHAEVNPFVKGSGTLISINNSILDGLSYAIEKLENRGSAQINLGSITKLNSKVQIIITDPPYLDDVIYAEFSEFFYSWERIGLQNICQLGDIQKSEEMSVGGWGRTNEFFNKLFRLSCKKMYELLDDDGLVVIFFAHSSVDGWDFVVNSMQKSGFRITATWPVRTESAVNPLAMGKSSILSSIIIVARKRKTNKSGYIEEIQEDIRDYLMIRLDEFWKYGLRGADLTVSAMGATLDIITQYSEIKSYTGEMKIKDVLVLVQKYVAQYVLNRYTKNASGLDAATSFYLYTRLSQLEGMPFDTANLIAKSMNVDLKLFEKQGLIKTSKKGKSQGIILLNFANREVNSKQSLIDCVQFVMTTFAKGGYTEVERELATITFSRNEIKDVLEALLSLPTEDPERQIAQKILERMGQSFPKQGQTGLDNF